MMGWVWLIVIGVMASGLLLALRLRRGMWSIAGAALMIGAIGYALQGSPGLRGHPVKANAHGLNVDPDIIALRSAMFGRQGNDELYFTTSDGLERAGEATSAVKLLLGAINHTGGDAALWSELGMALSAHDGGYVSPAAQLAFSRARQLAPDTPGPLFFAGLAHARAGDFAAVKPLWERALAVTPADADYRNQIAARLEILNRYLTMINQNQ